MEEQEPFEDRKLQCAACGWVGHLPSQTLRAQSPFITEETIYGCPECKSILENCLTMVWLCDEDGCTAEVACGYPTPDGGYRDTCHAHSGRRGV